MTGDDITVDLFAGPGGWDTAAATIGLERVVGIELDAAACKTRAAAGHPTIRARVDLFPVAQLAGKVTGLIGSPPCTTFSAAGDQAGNTLLELLEALISVTLNGEDQRGEYAARMARALAASRWKATLEPGQRAAKIAAAVASAVLVAEPARYIAATRPEWVTLEQVTSVLPLWQHYAAWLRAAGYSAWAGILNAADYGVPQTRQRAILIASRVRRVSRPAPTHYDARKGMQLFGEPWVSMADALGWGATGRPVPTVTAGGTATGGAEPIGHRGRDALAAEQSAGRWALQSHQSVAGGERAERRPGQPATTIVSGSRSARWMLRNNNTANACVRSASEPAGTMYFGHRANDVAWVRERPATTVQGDPRIGRPGHKDWTSGESQFTQDSVRITVAEAAALQSFPPGYPWQGTRTKQFEQVGNAVPPRLAARVLAMATGTEAAL